MVIWSRRKDPLPLLTDIHSHLIPGIDDGVKDLDQALQILEEMSVGGIRKAVTTPHIRHDKYPNTPVRIREGLDQLREAVHQAGIPVEIEAAAEYYIDEYFLETIRKGEDLLSFGDRYLLMETSFLNKSLLFDLVVFELRARNYRPVLAHPERYEYLEPDLSWLGEIHQRGILFQSTISSFVGGYGEMPKKIANRLMKEGMIDFLGSDIHRPQQIRLLKEGLKSTPVKKLLANGLINQKIT